MPLTILRNDITKMNVDIIVNAANTKLHAGGGVCGAIFNAAGVDRLQKACDKLSPIGTGSAVITKGYALPAKYIIHTAGPVYRDGKQNEEVLLRSCYINTLELAKKCKCKSIAFPLISSGTYGYPKEEALAVATGAISEWLMENDMDVSLVVYDKVAFSLSNNLLGEVKAFIDENYVDERKLRFNREQTRLRAESESYDSDVSTKSASLFDTDVFKESYDATITSVTDGIAERKRDVAEEIFKVEHVAASQIRAQMAPLASRKANNLDDVVGRLDEPFSTTLFRLIDVKGKTDVEVYKRANLDRKLFSKIRNSKGYIPSKKTVVALAVALELSLPETHDLLRRAGFALSRSVVFDVIIEYFITNRRYNIFDINNVLFEYDQSLLGGI